MSAGRCARCELLESYPTYIVRSTLTLEEVRALMDSRPGQVEVLDTKSFEPSSSYPDLTAAAEAYEAAAYSVPGTAFGVGRRDSDRQGLLDFE